LLFQLWRQHLVEGNEENLFSESYFESVSTEVDAMMLYLLTRSNSQIRGLCFKVYFF